MALILQWRDFGKRGFMSTDWGKSSTNYMITYYLHSMNKMLQMLIIHLIHFKQNKQHVRAHPRLRPLWLILSAGPDNFFIRVLVWFLCPANECWGPTDINRGRDGCWQRPKRFHQQSLLLPRLLTFSISTSLVILGQLLTFLRAGAITRSIEQPLHL